jgi:IgA Peptidase M64.
MKNIFNTSFIICAIMLIAISCNKDIEIEKKSNNKLVFSASYNIDTKAHWNDENGKQNIFEWDATTTANANLITTVFDNNSIKNWGDNKPYSFVTITPDSKNSKFAQLSSISNVGNFSSGDKTYSFAPVKEDKIVKTTDGISITFDMPNNFIQSDSYKLDELKDYSYIHSETNLIDNEGTLTSEQSSFNAIPAVLRYSIVNDFDSESIYFKRIEMIAIDETTNDTIAIFPNQLIYSANKNSIKIKETSNTSNYHKIISATASAEKLVNPNETHCYFSYVLPNDDVNKFNNVKFKFTIYAKKKSDNKDYYYTLERDITEKLYTATGEKRFLSGKIYTLSFNLKSMTENIVKTAYANGDYILYQKSTKTNPFTIIFTGDGYLESHFAYGGKFDKDVNEAIEAMFSFEPYKSLKDYFTIYKIAFYSNEAGASYKDKTTKDTYFKSVLTGNGSTGISCDYNKVFESCKKISGVTDENIFNGASCVIINEDYYAGTCMSQVGFFEDPTTNKIERIVSRCVAMSTVPRTNHASTAFANTVLHELGGHGIGRLADEYTTNDGNITETFIKQMDKWQGYNFYLNVSHTPDNNSVPWKHFLINQIIPM